MLLPLLTDFPAGVLLRVPARVRLQTGGQRGAAVRSVVVACVSGIGSR